jgi:hypothetical protein
MLRNEVYDLNFKRIGLLEQFDYCQYVEKLYGGGSFSIKCPYTDDNIRILKEDNIIWFEDNRAGIIQSIQDDDSTSAELEVNGSLIDVFLDWRFVYPVYNGYDYPERIMEEVVDKHCINTDNAKRKIPSLVIVKAEISDGESKITKQQTGGSVLELEQELGQPNNLGFRVGFYPREKEYRFEVIKGKDRTYRNVDGNKNVMFSETLNNIMTSSYSSDNSSYKNTVLVDGEENESTKQRTSLLIFENDTEVSGFERRELYVDARDLQSETNDDDGNSKTLTAEEYKETLRTRGEEKRAECEKKVSLEIETRSDAETIFNYRKDYNLGDKVTIIKESLGLREDVIVTEVTVTQDKNTYSIEPTFGESKPTLYTVLKRKGVLN